MANLINQQFFVRETNIGGVENAATYQVVCQFVAQYEPVMLQKAMGYAFWKLFSDVIYVVIPPTSGRFYDIVAGAEYVCNGITKKWNGLKTDTTTYKSSIIANYVYYYYMKNMVTQTAMIGEVKANAENAAMNTVGYKQVKNWNDMVRQVRLLWEFLKNKRDNTGALVYPEFNMSQVDCTHFRFMNTFGL
jgi:hypothetical protein